METPDGQHLSGLNFAHWRHEATALPASCTTVPSNYVPIETKEIVSFGHNIEDIEAIQDIDG